MLLGVGSGRNFAPLLAAGLEIDAVEENTERAAAASRAFAEFKRVRVLHAPYRNPVAAAGRYAGVLSTHALLHGTPALIAEIVTALRRRLAADGHFFATIGSKRDARFGRGTCVAPNAFAPTDGDEAGVTHAFFDEAGVRTLFRGFELETIREESAAGTVGAWAHDPDRARDVIHWFVRARRRR
ncbi:MAG: hypothetical protein M3R44_04025 [Candidatus Eremiobacteraeota bacterium]|nr:hypothetical protein [Candidatus Eremiobacteraeota bacterium]